MSEPTCVTCNATVSFAIDPILGELVDCQSCGEELEVTDLDPVTVRLAPELDEDWGE